MIGTNFTQNFKTLKSFRRDTKTMVRTFIHTVVLSGVLGCFAFIAAACPVERPAGDIIVALRDKAQPFSYFDEFNEPAGFAYDLWRRVERSISVPDGQGGARSPEVTFVACNKINEQELALVSGYIDVVIAPLTITAQRMLSYDFSQQYLSSGLALALPPTNAIDFEQARDIVVDTVFHPTVAQAVIGFLTLNLLMAVLIRWILLSEPDRNLPPGALWMRSALESLVRTIGLRGVGDGYSTASAKVLEIFMAVVGTALSATLLGVLTSAFVGSVGGQQQVSSAELTGMSIATLNCSTAQNLLLTEYRQKQQQAAAGSPEAIALTKRVAQLTCAPDRPRDTDVTVMDDPALKGSVRLVGSWREAADLLAAGEVGAALGDWIALTYLSRQDTHKGKISVLPTVYRNEPYGWGISRASVSLDLRRQIDRALIQQMRNRNWRTNLENALGTGSVSPN